MAMVKEYEIVLKLNGTLGNIRQPESKEAPLLYRHALKRGVLFICMSFYL